MRIHEKIINGILVRYSYENDIISEQKIIDFDITSYQRTTSNNIYDTCLEITTFCNQECINCFSESSYRRKGSEMDYKNIERCIRERIEERIRFIISGGEPFLHSDINNILKLPLKYPNANYWLNTNGYIKEINPYIEQIIDNEWNIAISIHGSEKTHNLYTKRDSYKLAKKNLFLLSTHSLTHIYSVINEYTSYEDIKHMIELRNKSNACFLRFIVPRKYGRYNNFNKQEIINNIPCSRNVIIKKDASNTEFISVNGFSRMLN